MHDCQNFKNNDEVPDACQKKRAKVSDDVSLKEAIA
jgi:hypothetical protein